MEHTTRFVGTSNTINFNDVTGDFVATVAEHTHHMAFSEMTLWLLGFMVVIMGFLFLLNLLTDSFPDNDFIAGTGCVCFVFTCIGILILLARLIISWFMDDNPLLLLLLGFPGTVLFFYLKDTIPLVRKIKIKVDK